MNDCRRNRHSTRSMVLLAVVAMAALSVHLAAIGAPGDDEPKGAGRDIAAIEGYTDTPIVPGTRFHKHDPDRPRPPIVVPGRASTPEEAGKAPSDAIVLFDGTDLSRFAHDGWTVVDGTAMPGKSHLKTTQSFGDCQLHLEWAAPSPPAGPVYNRGNSGVFMMEKYELQIFDSYSTRSYADGMAAAVYGETPPMANVCRPPGEWQVYDIVFTAPVFEERKLVEPARVTMFHNGVLVQYHQEIHGPCKYKAVAPYTPHPARMPLMIQYHGSPVRFRNIWIRDLELGKR